MSYKVLFTCDDVRRRVQAHGSRLPQEVKDAIAAHLKELEANPFAMGRVPPSPPFPPTNFGLMSFCKCVHEKRTYFVNFFFIVDKKTESVAVWKIIMSPQFNKPVDPGEA